MTFNQFSRDESTDRNWSTHGTGAHQGVAPSIMGSSLELHEGFGVIGEPADTVVPALIGMFRTDNFDFSDDRTSTEYPIFYVAKTFHEAIKVTLGAWGVGEAAIPFLVDALNDEDLAVQRGAIAALGDMVGLGIELDALNDPQKRSEQLRKGPPQALIEAVPHLVNQLDDENVRTEVAQALLFLSASDAVVEALSQPDPKVRMGAAFALGCHRQHGNFAVPPLTEALNDENPEVRRAVIEALKQIGTPEAMNALKAVEKTEIR